VRAGESHRSLLPQGLFARAFFNLHEVAGFHQSKLKAGGWGFGEFGVVLGPDGGVLPDEFIVGGNFACEQAGTPIRNAKSKGTQRRERCARVSRPRT
jgi:hypothetical protein